MAKADLIAKAQSLGVKLTGQETVPQLEELIKSAPVSGKLIKHIVTEEDMLNNPELESRGIKVGDEIEIPAVDGQVEGEEGGDGSASDSEVSQETTSEAVDNAEDAKADEPSTDPDKPVVCWYVWNEKSEFVKSFHENDHHGEAKKQAEAFASGHEGWTVTA